MRRVVAAQNLVTYNLMWRNIYLKVRTGIDNGYFPRLRTNKSRPNKCTGCTGMQAHGALEDNPSDDDPLLATCSLT